ncbi:MAG TPA: prepilin peptidase [Gemmatimonadaceae bacterium]|nr:prepilin peptidase [Gemmatimonadaceae bacterium]
MIPPALLLTFAFLTGAAVGSFLNVCISRWPLNLSVVRPRSRCPRCERSITWYENVPIVSWIVLRGKCRGCRLPISIQYPAVELGIALLWVAAFAAFSSDWFLALRVAVFTTVLVGIAVTDLKHYLIPDGFTVFGLLWLFTTSLAAAMMSDPGMFASPYDSLIGACVGAGAISIIGWLGEVALGKEAMGFGDVTLMAVVGAALGPPRTLLTIFVGAAVGALVFIVFVAPIVWLRRRRAGAGGAAELPLVPFGVFLAPAALFTLLKGDAAIAWYLSRLGLR